MRLFKFEIPAIRSNRFAPKREEIEEESTMVKICFVLDLRSLAPSLLADLKQSLLQLANYFAISSPSSSSNSTSDYLRDKVGLCYIYRDRLSSLDELKVAYNPRRNFSLRDFHHAVHNLPADAFLPDVHQHSDAMLSTVLSDRVLYSWEDKEIERKVIFLSSHLPEDVDSAMQKTLMDAAENCVSVDFVLFQHKSSLLTDVQENINNFRKCISHIDNCSFHTYVQDVRVLHGMVKQWLQVLKEDLDEPLHVRLTFKDNLVDSVNHISCNLYALASPIIDGFDYCQACRCHGISLDDTDCRKKPLSCPVTEHNLGVFDVIETSLKVGEKTILYFPSIQNPLKFPKVTSPINLSAIERANLGRLSEGLLMGASFVVIPSPSQETEVTSEDTGHPDLNAQLFRGLCSALYSLDQGLVCSSNCNIEKLNETHFCCYYVLQPSEKGPMLLRRLAGSEEILHIPDAQPIASSVDREVENSVHASISKIPVTDYDPLLHERGFHQKLNLLVEESFQFGSMPPHYEVSSELNSSELPPVKENLNAKSAKETIVIDGDDSHIDSKAAQDKTISSIAEEWEQLVVHEATKIRSPSFTYNSKSEQSCISSPDNTRQRDVNTTKILERLEVPRQFKTKAVSPMGGTCVPTKKPLTPLQPMHAAEQLVSGSQLMKPNFQRLKRKQK